MISQPSCQFRSRSFSSESKVKMKTNTQLFQHIGFNEDKAYPLQCLHLLMMMTKHMMDRRSSTDRKTYVCCKHHKVDHLPRN
jgi:hypothetical protein